MKDSSDWSTSMVYRSLWAGLLPVGALLWGVPTARAVVLTINANVTAEVREHVNGEVVNSDFAFDELDVTTRNLPLVAEVQLLPPIVDGEVDGEDATVLAAATTTFRDPRLSATGPPNEFAAEVVGFSNSDLSTVTGRSEAVEIREVVFEPDEVDIDAGTEVLARSHFFLDGIMVLLAEPGASGLAGGRTELILRVVQERADAEPQVVLDASVVLVGNTDGTATLEVTGDLSEENLTTFGLQTLTSDQGSFQAVVLPELAIPYTYPALIGETFTLRAEIFARFEAGPGTGAAVVLGDRLNTLGDVLAETLGEDLAAGFEAGLTAGLSGVPLPAVPLVAAEQNTVLEIVTDAEQGLPGLGGPFCGLLGAESAMLAAGLTILSLCARKRAKN